MHNYPYENEFNLQVNEISFSYERKSTKTRFENEPKGNSEMDYPNYFYPKFNQCFSVGSLWVLTI